MRKRIMKWLLPMLLVLLTVGLSSCGKNLAQQSVLHRAKQTNTIVWGVKADTNLFGLLDVKSNTIKGFDVDMAKAITKRILGKKGHAEFVTITSDTRMPMLKAGNIDAIVATMSITPDRKKQVDFSDVYFKAGGSLLVKKGSKIHSVKDLKKGTKVIVTQGSTYGDEIKKAAPQTQVLQLADYASAFTALKSGQADALSTDNGILYGMSAQDHNYELVGGTYTKEPYGIAVNKGQRPFLRQVNRAIKDMKADGEYARLVKKWFGDIPGFSLKEVE
ncbi:glutamate ABC transporter substrate-binding protein [Lacticaseibacillus thailandensis]|uniref:Amino acid ABC transporter substrate-binding protein n=1 Tax=Lacticaseibacillus thailandensis DSM 22698 = JCM 13996 TaxID=1423810 RepID=A0A0R2CHT8_9LACO|nr:glutamate ABC transporter substrate-binding protein [Lacticaseibacillus thailandensis]KRM87574.1 amino acid ABC transporter substrate-binding protein [Lacticaseibacillus thailandensis DSM 22698 = JCM 13996]